MADEIATKYANLKITEEESDVVALDEATDDNHDESIEFSLVGKILSIRPYNFDAMKKTMNQVWSISKGALFRPIENDLFVVQFANKRDKSKVMSGRPWNFDQNLMLLTEIEGTAQPSNISMTHCPFWVRLYNLPMDCRTENKIKMIGGGLGQVMEVDFDGVGWDKSARLKVLMDITKPLRRIQKIRSSSGSIVMVDIKYERLPNYCYGCGRLGHIERDCLFTPEEDRDGDKQWGSWLRASPRRGRLKMEEEVKDFRSCARSLPFAGTIRTNTTDVTIMATREENIVPGVMNAVTMLGKNMDTHLESLREEQNKEGLVYEEWVQLGEERVDRREESALEEERSEGVSKCAREFEGQPPKCARELGTLGEEVNALTGTDEKTGVESYGPPMTFAIGVGHGVLKKQKKAAKKYRQVMQVQGGKTEDGVGVGKRKSSWMESEMDGEDTRMDEMDVQGKKLKLSRDNFDGSLSSLTVAEVGQHQPREDQ